MRATVSASETQARVAVAEERARIARELHDIVAHAVSVMVLQVGAGGTSLDSLAEDGDALRGVERTGRTALAEMRSLLGAMRRGDDEAELVPQPGLDGLELREEIGRAGLLVGATRRRRAGPAPTRDRSLRLSHRSGRADECTQARARDASTSSCATGPTSSSSRSGRRHRQLDERRPREGPRRHSRTSRSSEMAAGAANEGGFVLSTRLLLRSD